MKNKKEKTVEQIAKELYKKAGSILRVEFNIPNGVANPETQRLRNYTDDEKKKLCIAEIVKKLNEDPVRIQYYQDPEKYHKKNATITVHELCRPLFDSKKIPFKQRLQKIEKPKVNKIKGQIVVDRNTPTAP